MYAGRLDPSLPPFFMVWFWTLASIVAVSVPDILGCENLTLPGAWQLSYSAQFPRCVGTDRKIRSGWHEDKPLNPTP